MSFHALLQRILLAQRLKLGLPHCRQILYHLRYPGSPQCLRQQSNIIKIVLGNPLGSHPFRWFFLQHWTLPLFLWFSPEFNSVLVFGGPCCMEIIRLLTGLVGCSLQETEEGMMTAWTFTRLRVYCIVQNRDRVCPKQGQSLTKLSILCGRTLQSTEPYGYLDLRVSRDGWLITSCDSLFWYLSTPIVNNNLFIFNSYLPLQFQSISYYYIDMENRWSTFS